jgi:hypothetical protein
MSLIDKIPTHAIYPDVHGHVLLQVPKKGQNFHRAIAKLYPESLGKSAFLQCPQPLDPCDRECTKENFIRLDLPLINDLQLCVKNDNVRSNPKECG